MGKRSRMWGRWTGALLAGLAVVVSLRGAAVAQNKMNAHHATALEEAARLGNEAIKLYGNGKYDAAILLGERALTILEKELGPDDPGIASSLHNVALFHMGKGDYLRAEKLYQRAIAIVESTLGKDHPDVAQVLNSLAGLYENKGDDVRAEPLFRRAAAIWEKALGPDHPNVAASLNNLAELHHRHGDYARAELLFRRATAIWEKAFGPDHPNVATSLNNVAALYKSIGAYGRAEPLYQRSAAILEKALGTDHPSVAASLNNLALLYNAKGDYVRAESLYQRALSIWENALGRAHPHVATALNNLADVYLEKGDYGRAEPLYQRALAIREDAFGKDNSDVAISLNSLATLYLTKGDYGRAEPLYQRACAISEKALGPDHRELAASLNNLAALYDAKGDDGRAEPLYRRALAMMERALGPDHPDVAASLNNLARLCDELGDDGRAELYHDRALTIRERALGPDHPDVATSINNLAVLHWARNEVFRALKEMERGNSVNDRNAARELAVGADEQRHAYMRKLRGETDVTISLHIQSAPRRENAKRLAVQTILHRKGLILDAMATSFGNLRARLHPNQRSQLDELHAITAQYSALVQRGPDKQPLEAYRALVKDVNDKRQKLENDLSFISKDLQTQLNPVTIEQVQNALPKDAALVELFQYRPFNPKAKGTEKRWRNPRFVAYILRPNGHIDFADLGEAKPIEDAVKAMRLALSTEARDPKPAAHDLYQHVMAPIVKLLGQTEHVYISPDGVLSLVPFGAMIGPDGHYVAENLAITYLTTGRDLVRWTNQVSRQPSAVFSAPSYEAGDHSKRRAQRSFGLLWAGVAEGRAVQAKLRDATLFDGARATESALKALHGPEVVHISTHGFFDNDLAALHELPRQPFDLRPQPPVENALLRSGLAFAGANHGGIGDDDGILTAMEASQLDLWGTKLVVLAACDTGRGEVENGDGVYGLRRAFAIAGAETVVMSLWSVDADATTELVTRYYDGLEKGGGRAEALRQAKLAMLANSRRSHPHYWASLIVSGNDNAMDGHLVPSMFGRITRGGTCGACEIGTHESSCSEIWLCIAITGAVLRLRRRGAAHVENGR